MEQIQSQIERMGQLIEEAAATTSAWRAIELEYGRLYYQMQQFAQGPHGGMGVYMLEKLREMDANFMMYLGVKKASNDKESHRDFARRFLQLYKNNALKPYKAA